MSWTYNGRCIDGTNEHVFGARAFVYVVTNLQDGRQYFGKKRLQFVSHKRKKGRRNRIKVVKISDWESYWGSNDQLKADIQRLGEDQFRREILRFCRSLSESNYYELKYQMDNDVLLHPDKFYNSYVGGRISRKQLGIK